MHVLRLAQILSDTGDLISLPDYHLVLDVHALLRFQGHVFIICSLAGHFHGLFVRCSGGVEAVGDFGLSLVDSQLGKAWANDATRALGQLGVLARKRALAWPLGDSFAHFAGHGKCCLAACLHLRLLLLLLLSVRWSDCGLLALQEGVAFLSVFLEALLQVAFNHSKVLDQVVHVHFRCNSHSFGGNN